MSEERHDLTKFVSLMIRDKKTLSADKAKKRRVDPGPCNWAVLETEPNTAKARVRLEAKCQRLLAQGKDVIVTRTVLKPDDPKFGISRRAKRAQKRSFRPMQRMLRRRQKRLDAVIEKEFAEREIEEPK